MRRDQELELAAHPLEARLATSPTWYELVRHVTAGRAVTITRSHIGQLARLSVRSVEGPPPPPPLLGRIGAAAIPRQPFYGSKEELTGLA